MMRGKRPGDLMIGAKERRRNVPLLCAMPPFREMGNASVALGWMGLEHA